MLLISNKSFLSPSSLSSPSLCPPFSSSPCMAGLVLSYHDDCHRPSMPPPTRYRRLHPLHLVLLCIHVHRWVSPASGSILSHRHRSIASASTAGLASTHHARRPRPPSLWPHSAVTATILSSTTTHAAPSRRWVRGLKEWGGDASCHLREERATERRGWVRRERNVSGVG